MASAVVSRRRVFDADVAPGRHEDCGEANLIVSVGSNSAWRCPALFERTKLATAQRGARLSVIDPRRAATADFADLLRRSWLVRCLRHYIAVSYCAIRLAIGFFSTYRCFRSRKVAAS